MKNELFKSRLTLVTCSLVVSGWICFTATAQTQSASNISTSSDYICVQRGPDSKVWQRTAVRRDPSGAVQTNTESYTEIATGLSYLRNGQYVDSVEEVDAVAGGAQATQGQHQVQWALNANTPGGAVVVTTPDSKTLSSTVYGLAYFDTASGSNAAIARLQDCTGSIVAPNQVIYTNAFSNLTADLQYAYRKAGITQDVALRQSPPAPDRYGLSDETTVLQVYTEFFDAPQPAVTAATNGNAVNDQILDFGKMRMGVGQTLFLNGQGGSISAGTVSKKWAQADGRTFLIESIPYAAISNQLHQLPQASNVKPAKGSIRRTAFLDSKPSRPAVSIKQNRAMKLAKLEMNQPRVLIDYDLLSSTNVLTLQGDTTYLVSGTVNVSSSVTIEGGTVVKYTNSGAGEIVGGDIACETAPYRPAAFTSMDDNSVGTTISGSTGSPTIASTYFSLSLFSGSPTIFQNLRFSYAATALSPTVYYSVYDDGSVTIWDCQFRDCTVACTVNVQLESVNLNVYNVLLSDVTAAITKASGSVGVLYTTAINVTADDLITLGGGDSFSAINSIFTSIYAAPTDNLTSCYKSGSSNGVYQTVGAGSYYLADGSTNRGAGTTNIPTELLADLAAKTTYPPVTFSSFWFTNDYTFFPQAQRDNNGSTVDLGYHYDPLDYALNTLVSNAIVTVLPGTALAMEGYEFGIWFYSDATFNCEGTATSPNYIVRYNTVQEQSTTNWETTNWEESIFGNSDDGSAPAGNFQFTDWSILGGDKLFYSTGGNGGTIAFQNCQVYNGEIYAVDQTLLATNCLFQRVNFNLNDVGSGGISDTFYNNLFLEGEVTNHHSGSGIWTFRDNLFSRTIITNKASSTIDVCSNNAYVFTNSGVLLPENNDVIVSGDLAFETGDLGQYYYPPTQTNLIHTGSQLASAAGLYHYTVTTNNAIEGTNIVSIGFHYVACGANGLPLVSNGDGIPDYLADANGNGLIDSGEIAWTNVPGDLGLTVVITQPANNSKLP